MPGDLLLLLLTKWSGNVFSHIGVSVCEEALTLVCWYILSIVRSSLYIKVIGSRSRSQAIKVSVCHKPLQSQAGECWQSLSYVDNVMYITMQ